MKMKFCNYLRLCGLLSLLLFAATDATAVTRYVKPAASGNGSSWENASGNLQAMIDASASDDVVWVAAGTYTPSAYPTGCVGCSTNRDFAFSLKNGVKVYGGFAGTETTLSQRTVSNRSILSGDIGIANNSADNAYHVVILANVTSTLDGFTITAGNANGSNSITVNTKTLAQNTGGALLAQVATCTLNNNTFTSNSATKGGGIYAQSSSHTLTNTTIINNTATDGGGFYGYSSNGNILNICFANNTAIGFGGAVYINQTLPSPSAGQATTALFNNTFSRNSAGLTGGGIYTNFGPDKVTSNKLLNNIFWENKKGTASNVPGADYENAKYVLTFNYNTFKNNLLQLSSSYYSGNSYGLGSANSNNKFGVDPLFANALDVAGSDGLHRTEDDGLCLRSSSPATDAGILDAGVPLLDIRGYARTAIQDMGAYEGAAPKILYVKPIASGTGDGSSWANASNNLQAMLNTAGTGGQVWIAAGTYKPGAYPAALPTCLGCSTPRDYAFRLLNGIRVYGGFAGTETTLNQRNVSVNQTILSGDIGIANVANDNCYHVVMVVFASGDLASKTVLDGVTVSGGNANVAVTKTISGLAVSAEQGGGIFLLNGSNTISNCVISNNFATSGAGLAVTNSKFTVSNSFFLNNNASRNGGGVSVVLSSEATFNNNVFSSNLAQLGGGMYSKSGTNSLFNNTFVNNAASNGIATQQRGGAFFTEGPNNNNNKLLNNLFWGNKSQNSTTIASADFHSNNSFNICRFNLFQLSSSLYSLTYNSLGIKGTNNKFAANPMFANAADIDGADNRFFTADDGLRLQTGSPAIRAGYTIEMPATDIRGIVRPTTTTTSCDMGAYQGIFGQIREAAPVGEANIKTDAKKDETIQPNVLNVLPTTSFRKSTSVRVYPTQVQDVLFVEGAATYKLINVATGQVLLQSIENQLHIAHLPKGMYIVQGNDLQGLPFAVKIVLN